MFVAQGRSAQHLLSLIGVACDGLNATDSQCTVVTETRGPLAGVRVVRGREEECRAVVSRDRAISRARA